MIIQHNISALNAHRQLAANNTVVGKNLEKLSSGFRINRAGDDAAGLAISEKMRSQIKGLETAQKNAQDGISLVQTAEGALTEVHSMLNRMVELSTQASNGTYTEGDRNKIQDEVDALTEEIDRISEGTNFNGINLLDGSIGAGSFKAEDTFEINKQVDKLVMTDISGSSFSKGGNYTIETGTVGADGTFTAGATATDSDVRVKFTDTKTGDVSSSFLKLDDVIKTKANDGTMTGIADATGTVAANSVGVIDLSAVGIGKIEFAAAADSGDANTVLGAVATAVGTTTEGVSGGGSLKLQVGDSNEDFQRVEVAIGSMSSSSLGVGKGDIKVTSELDANAAIDSINSAIETVSEQRGELGAVQNRLEHTINNLGVTTENMTAAESRIRDVDMAKEMMSFTKNNVLTQAAQAMLAQANQQPQGVLQLLR